MIPSVNDQNLQAHAYLAACWDQALRLLRNALGWPKDWMTITSTKQQMRGHGLPALSLTLLVRFVPVN